MCPRDTRSNNLIYGAVLGADVELVQFAFGESECRRRDRGRSRHGLCHGESTERSRKRHTADMDCAKKIKNKNDIASTTKYHVKHVIYCWHAAGDRRDKVDND